MNTTKTKTKLLELKPTQEDFERAACAGLKSIESALTKGIEHYDAEGVQVAIDMCHATATNAGWYANPKTGKPIKRNFGEVIALMHSELSEALEADRKSLRDDKLPHRSGVEVELADCVIRIFDTGKALGLVDAWVVRRGVGNTSTPRRQKTNVGESITQIHAALSDAYGWHKFPEEVNPCLAAAVSRCFVLAYQLRLDLPGAIIEKNAYNRQRADHKLANRAKAGGKKY